MEKFRVFHTNLVIVFLFATTCSGLGNRRCIKASAGVDFVSDKIKLLQPIEFGGCRHRIARIASNGYLTFGAKAYLMKVPVLKNEVPMVFAFGTDLDSGLICYDQWYNESWAVDRTIELVGKWLPNMTFVNNSNLVFAVSYYDSKLSCSFCENASASFSLTMLVLSNGSNTQIFTLSTASNSTTLVINNLKINKKSLDSNDINICKALIGYSPGNGDQAVVTGLDSIYVEFNDTGQLNSSNTIADLNFTNLNKLIYSTSTYASAGNSSCVTQSSTNPADRNEAIIRFSMKTAFLQSAPSTAVQLILVPVRIPFGGCIYRFAQISSQGFIRLLLDAAEVATMREFYYGPSIFGEECPIVAPFATDGLSVVTYRTFESKERDSFNLVSQLFRENVTDFDFLTDQFFMLLVTFQGLTSANDRRVSITAQTVLVTNGPQTYVVFNYGRDVPGTVNWPGSVWPKPRVSIGFSFGLYDSQAPAPQIIASLPKIHGVTSADVDYDYVLGNILGNTGRLGRWVFKLPNYSRCDKSHTQSTEIGGLRKGLLPHTYSELSAIRSKAIVDCLPSGSHDRATISTVPLNQPIPFGACIYPKVQISSFGVLGLGVNLDFDGLTSGYHRLSPGVSRYPLVAPLSARLSSEFGSVCYSQHTNQTSMNFLSLLSSVIAALRMTTNRSVRRFNPSYALTVTWTNVTLTDGVRLSFQAVLATDGKFTGLFLMHAISNRPFYTDLLVSKIGIGFTYGAGDNPMLAASGSLVHSSPRWPDRSSIVDINSLPTNTLAKNFWYFPINTTTGYCLAPLDSEAVRRVNFTNLLPKSRLPVQANKPAYQSCFAEADEAVYQVKLLRHIPLGGCHYSEAQVSTRGWISFGDHSNSNASLPLPFSDLPIPVFAPFYADSLSPSNDSICYSQHVYDNNNDDVDVEDIDPTLVEIRSRLRLLRKPSFHPTYALVVTYLDMSDKRHRQSPQQQRQSVTFQVAVFTDGVNTQFFYNYAPNNSDWSAAEDSPVFIGFSYGQSADRSGAQQTGNRSVSGLVNPSRHSNTGLAGVYLHEAPIFPAERCSLSTAGEKATSAEEIDSTDLTALLPSPQYAGNHTFANASCLSRAPVDDYSIGVKLPFPVPFGVHSHRIVHISTNGFILLSETPSQSLIFPRFEGPVFLPLNADYFADRNDSICWSMHSTDDRDDYFSAIDRHLANNSDYSILASKRHALVVTYRAMRVLGTERRLTFQFAMITNRTHLQFMFIYTANAAQEAKNRSFAARIGYSYGAQSGLSNYQTVLFNNLLGTNDSFGFAPAGDTGGSGTYLFSAERVNNGDCANRDFDCCDESDTPSLDSNLLPLAQHSECLPPADDASYRIDLNYAIEFGGCIFSAAYVSTNGYVTLGEAAKELDPEIHALSMPIFMPFAGDLTTMTGGSIWYSLHYRNDSYLRVITNCLELLNRSLSFPNLDFAVVITYYCVRDYRAPQRITFQLVLLCDKNGKLVAFYNYANSKKPWLITRRIQHGFSYGRTIDPFSNHSQVIIHASSSDFNTTLHLGNSAGNTGIRGVYFFEPELNITTNCQDINYGLSATKTNRMASASNLLQVSSNYSSIDCSLFGDDKRAFFNLTMPIEFGGCNYSALTVSTNGIIHLHNYDGKVIDRQPYFSVLSTDLYVPKGHLCVSQHFSMDRSSTSTSLSKDIDERLATLGLSPIATKYAIAVSYVKVMQYGLPNASFSFQFILFTDGNQTDFFFIYEESMELTVSPESRLLIGYSYGARNYTATAPYDFFLFYPPLLHQLNLTVRVKTHFGRSDYGTDYFRAVKMSQQTCD